MGSGEVIETSSMNKEYICQNGAICLHAFSNLSHTSPTVFVYLLKECYRCGTLKATLKFQVLQKNVIQALESAPQLDPYTFVVRCLYVLPKLGRQYSEGFGHLLTSSLRRLNVQPLLRDSSEVKRLSTQLVVDVLSSSIIHEERILLKIIETFDVGLNDIRVVIYGSELNHGGFDIAKALIEHYISGFIKSKSYMTAVILAGHFSIDIFDQSFLVKLMRKHEFKAAEKLATFMGQAMICLVIQTYLDMHLLKKAYDMIKRHNLVQEFPDECHLYKKSSLKRQTEEGCWDLAEIRASNDRQLLEYLVYLAMEAGYMEKVDELCERYYLEGFAKTTDQQTEETASSTASIDHIQFFDELEETEESMINLESHRRISHLDLHANFNTDSGTNSQENPSGTHHLNPKDLFLNDIIWVDEIDGLQTATDYIETHKVIGVDCEWKPNYEKGSKPNKVSIMQIASDSRAYIFDLIKLYKNEPQVLNCCFRRIFSVPNILKLGYNFQCDLKQLRHSYGDLACFRYYEMILDIEKLFVERRGGLSALSKKILGASLNKTRQNCNWEQRPLSRSQIVYGALDAAALVHIFRRIHSQPHSADEGDCCKIDWKSHIVKKLYVN